MCNILYIWMRFVNGMCVMWGVVNNFVHNKSNLVLFCVMHQIFFLVQNYLLPFFPRQWKCQWRSVWDCVSLHVVQCGVNASDLSSISFFNSRVMFSNTIHSLWSGSNCHPNIAVIPTNCMLILTTVMLCNDFIVLFTMYKCKYLLDHPYVFI